MPDWDQNMCHKQAFSDALYLILKVRICISVCFVKQYYVFSLALFIQILQKQHEMNKYLKIFKRNRCTGRKALCNKQTFRNVLFFWLSSRPIGKKTYCWLCKELLLTYCPFWPLMLPADRFRIFLILGFLQLQNVEKIFSSMVLKKKDLMRSKCFQVYI